MSDPAETFEALRAEVGTVLVGKEVVLEHLVVAVLTGGHVLLEGVPGVAKTTLANLFARASGLEFRRIQLTPDVLPADITGTHVYRQQTGEFVLRRGPVFSNVVLADEINRATPKTQSALLEAMQEHQVTIEGETFDLPSPFIVVATQNPIEYEGTFELPVAQRDRFQLKINLDLPSRDEEARMLDRFNETPDLGPRSVQNVVAADDFLDARRHVQAVHVSELVREYILDLVRATRDHSDVAYGGSPRATLALLYTSKARAGIHGRDYVIPDDVKAFVQSVLVHRLVLTTDADLAGVQAEEVIAEVGSSVEPPGSTRDLEPPGPADGEGVADPGADE